MEENGAPNVPSLLQDPDKATALGQDFPGFYSPHRATVDTIIPSTNNTKSIVGTGAIITGLQIPGALAFAV